jgi:hypothetical protein
MTNFSFENGSEAVFLVVCDPSMNDLEQPRPIEIYA